MVKQLTNAWLAPAVLGLLAGIAGGRPENEDTPKPPPAEKVQAWREAGADVGWMKDLPPRSDAYDFWGPWRAKAEGGAIPAFRFPKKRADGVLEKLPDPGTAFGLDFHCGYYAGVSLKELAKLKHLQSLNIGAGNQGAAYTDLADLAGMTDLRALYLFYLRVTDEQTKHLARLKNLRVLDLSNTPLTDEGLKHLAGLEQLRWLNLRSTKVTPAGVAALQKKLPECKIVTVRD